MIWRAITLISLLVIVLPANAHAYLDPATGSAIIQMIVAGVMGALFVVRVYWQKIKSFFRGQPAADQPAAKEASASSVDEQH